MFSQLSFYAVLIVYNHVNKLTSQMEIYNSKEKVFWSIMLTLIGGESRLEPA